MARRVLISNCRRRPEPPSAPYPATARPLIMIHAGRANEVQDAKLNDEVVPRRRAYFFGAEPAPGVGTSIRARVALRRKRMAKQVSIVGSPVRERQEPSSRCASMSADTPLANQ